MKCWMVNGRVQADVPEKLSKLQDWKGVITIAIIRGKGGSHICRGRETRGPFLTSPGPQGWTLPRWNVYPFVHPQVWTLSTGGANIEFHPQGITSPPGDNSAPRVKVCPYGLSLEWASDAFVKKIVWNIAQPDIVKFDTLPFTWKVTIMSYKARVVKFFNATNIIARF
jgi:hypothetical protein